MTNSEPTVSSEDELRSQLETLFQRAHENDVDVEGGWECRNGDGHPDWDVIVTEVQKPQAED